MPLTRHASRRTARPARPGRAVPCPDVASGHAQPGRASCYRAAASASARAATTLARVSRWCEQQGVLPESLTLGRRSLEDVFLELTGREMQP